MASKEENKEKTEEKTPEDVKNEFEREANKQIQEARKRNDAFCIIDFFDVTDERAKEMHKEFNNKKETVPEITDLLHWIKDNFEGDEEKLLLVWFGSFAQDNNTQIQRSIMMQEALGRLLMP